MPKVLLCASTAVHIKNFHLSYLAYFREHGFEVHVAVPGGGNFDGAHIVHDVPITKHPVSVKNLIAALEIRRLVRTGGFDLILVHTTLAAFVTRLGVLLAGKARPRLINTVHGYFFWKGCGLLKKLAYYLPERLLRSVTDCVITMNAEDTVAAEKLVKKGGCVVKVHGMGVDASRFTPADFEAKHRARMAYGIAEEAYVMVYPAEFSPRKNHLELIRALDEVRGKVPEVLLLLCGTGALEAALHREIAERQLEKHVRFLGWCDQMASVYAACDMAVSTSKSEGLPFNIAEAQLSALPVIASEIRGHTDLIRNGETGWCYTAGDAHQLAELILKVIDSPDVSRGVGTAARQSALQFSLDVAFDENIRAYQMILDE